MPDIDLSPVRGVIDHVNGVLSGVVTTLTGITDAIHGWLTDVIQGLLPGLTEALIGAVTHTGELANVLANNLISTEDLTGAVGEHWDAAQVKLLSQFDALAGSILHGASRGVRESWEGFITWGSGDMIRDAMRHDPAPMDPQKLLDYANSLPGPLRALFELGTLVAAGPGILAARLAGANALYQQASYRDTMPVPITPPDLALLVVQNQAGQDWAEDQAKRSGLSPELFRLLLTITGEPPGADTVLQLWNRGVLTEDQVTTALRQSRVKNEYIDPIKALRYTVIPPTDLVRFMVRDAFDQSVVDRYQYDAEFDAKYVAEWFDKAGVSQDIARYYWRSHWQLPSPTQLYEMLHRGIIKPEDVQTALRVNDYAPTWIDPLIGISYDVLGRIDVRRMYHAGVITTHEELVSRHTAMGYSPADAEFLATFVETAEKQARDSANDKSPVATHVASAYAAGTLTEAEARASFTALGISDARTTELLTLSQADREKSRDEKIRTAIGREYVAGTMTEADARSRLGAYGFSDAEQSLVFDAWQLDRELREITDAEKHQKDLTQAQLIAAYEDRILSHDDAAAALLALGYDAGESATLLALSDAKIAAADAKVAQEAIRVQYVARRLTDQDAAQQLDALGLRTAQRDSLLSRWSVDRENARPELPLSTLTSLAEKQIIPQDDLTSDLNRRGYSDLEIQWLLQLWGYDVAQAVQRTQVATDALTEKIREFDLRQQTTQQRFDQARADKAARDQAAAQQKQALADAARADKLAMELQREQVAAASDARKFDQQASLLDKRVQAAQAAADKAAADRAAHDARQADLRLQLSQAQDVRQQKTIQTQVDLTQRKLDAAAALQQQRQQAAQELADMRAQAQAAADQRRADAKAADEQRQQAAQIAKEQRAQTAQIAKEDRQTVSTIEKENRIAAQKAALEATRLGRSAALATLGAQLDAATAQRLQQQADATQQQTQAQLDTLYQKIRARIGT